MNQRWTESEKLTPKPDPKTKNLAPKQVSLQIFDSGFCSVPVSAMLLHTYILHHMHTESGSGFSQKFKSGPEKCSRIPDPLRSVPISGMDSYSASFP